MGCGAEKPSQKGGGIATVNRCRLSRSSRLSQGKKEEIDFFIFRKSFKNQPVTIVTTVTTDKGDCHDCHDCHRGEGENRIWASGSIPQLAYVLVLNHVVANAAEISERGHAPAGKRG